MSRKKEETFADKISLIKDLIENADAGYTSWEVAVKEGQSVRNRLARVSAVRAFLLHSIRNLSDLLVQIEQENQLREMELEISDKCK
jgi:hypothetical protein